MKLGDIKGEFAPSREAIDADALGLAVRGPLSRVQRDGQTFIEGPDGQLLGPISGEGVFQPQAIDDQASVIVGDNRFSNGIDPVGLAVRGPLSDMAPNADDLSEELRSDHIVHPNYRPVADQMGELRSDHIVHPNYRPVAADPFSELDQGFVAADPFSALDQGFETGLPVEGFVLDHPVFEDGALELRIEPVNLFQGLDASGESTGKLPEVSTYFPDVECVFYGCGSNAPEYLTLS